MDPEKKPSTHPRPNISSRTIKLTHSDPVKRLKEFCKQGKYYHHMKWDKFANGYMVECEVAYNLGRYGHIRRRILTKEARWVETGDLLEAQRVVAAVLLDNLGVGISEDGEENEIQEEIEEDVSQNFAKASMKAVTGVLNQVTQQLDNNEEGDKDPLLSMAGGLIKQMTTMMTEENIQDETQECSARNEQTENTPKEKSEGYEYIPDEVTQNNSPKSRADMSENTSIASWADVLDSSTGNWGDMMVEETTRKSWADIAS